MVVPVYDHCVPCRNARDVKTLVILDIKDFVIQDFNILFPYKQYITIGFTMLFHLDLGIYFSLSHEMTVLSPSAVVALTSAVVIFWGTSFFSLSYCSISKASLRICLYDASIFDKTIKILNKHIRFVLVQKEWLKSNPSFGKNCFHRLR